MNMTFGQRIRTLRVSAGFSQEQLAEKLNISRQAVSKWENDDSAPDLERLALLGSLFHISLDQLVTGAPSGSGQTTPLDFEKLAEQNRLFRRKQVFTILGWTFCALAAISVAMLLSMQATTSALAYLLYRYAAVGEISYTSADTSLSRLLSALLFAAGCGCLLLSRRTHHDRYDLHL